MKTPIRVAVASIVVACAGASFGTFLNGANGADTAGPDDSAPVAYPAEKSNPQSHLSGKTIAGMRRANTDVEVLAAGDPGANGTRLDAKEAIHRASAQAGFLADANVGEVALGRITVKDHGEMQDARPGQPSKLKLHIENRRAWIVVFDEFTMPMLRPIPDPADETSSETEPEGGTSSMYVAIDAQTGEFLGARSLLDPSDID